MTKNKCDLLVAQAERDLASARSARSKQTSAYYAGAAMRVAQIVMVWWGEDADARRIIKAVERLHTAIFPDWPMI